MVFVSFILTKDTNKPYLYLLIKQQIQIKYFSHNGIWKCMMTFTMRYKQLHHTFNKNYAMINE